MSWGSKTAKFTGTLHTILSAESYYADDHLPLPVPVSEKIETAEVRISRFNELSEEINQACIIIESLENRVRQLMANMGYAFERVELFKHGVRGEVGQVYTSFSLSVPALTQAAEHLSFAANSLGLAVEEETNFLLQQDAEAAKLEPAKAE